MKSVTNFWGFIGICVLLANFTPSAKGHFPVEKVPLEDKAILTYEESIRSNGISLRKDAEPGPDYRLPASLIPRNYFLKLRPIIDRDHAGIGKKDTAPGFVRLSASCVAPTNRIVMHQKFLKINETSIEVKSKSDASSIDVTGVEYDGPRDFLIINLDKELRPSDDYEISMEFTANVPPNDTLRGLYSEKYFDELTNQTQVMAITQLEPLRARQVLPCLDEPTYKATFDVVIGRTENFTALGNGPRIQTETDAENPGWFWDTFNTTVKMPSYLLAIGVSNYSYSEAEPDLYRLPIKVHGPRYLKAKGRGQLTADLSARLMKYFEEKYQIPHNMPKVDSISVPYKRGAMENYGLITYGEYRLTYYPNTTLQTELRSILNLLAHELGHQWFGNLVTCKWWSDIWLNEGFATYVSYEVMDNFKDSVFGYDALDWMVHDSVNVALIFDATSASHPIHQEAYDAQQIGTNMDTIGYDKGASVVRMMVSFLGEEAFYDGIRHYLRRKYDDVAEQDDLFQDLDEAAITSGLRLPKSVKEIMHAWTLQKGFPLIRVSINGNDSVSFSQETWQNEESRNESTNPTTSWNVPVKYLIQTGQDSGLLGTLWLLQNDDQPQNVSIPNGSTGWVVTNPDAGGYYRTLYDEELARRIRTQLLSNHEVFEPAARIRILDDQFHLANQKYTSMQSALEFTKYLHEESNHNVWSSVMRNLFTIRNVYRNIAVIDSEDFTALQKYLGPKIQSAYEKLLASVNCAGNCGIQLNQLLDWSCSLNHELCDYLTKAFYIHWSENPSVNPIPNDIQSTVYCKIVENEGQEGFDFIANNYFQLSALDDDKHQRSQLSSALGCTNDSRLATVLVSMILDSNSTRRINKVDSIAALSSLFGYSQAGPSVLSLELIHSPKRIPDYYEGDLSSVLQIFSSATFFATPVHYIMMESIAEAYPEFYGSSLNSTITTIAQNIDWLMEHREDVTGWLKANAL